MAKKRVKPQTLTELVSPEGLAAAGKRALEKDGLSTFTNNLGPWSDALKKWMVAVDANQDKENG